MAQPDSLRIPLQGVERAMLISSSDPTMLEVQSNLIDAAQAAGVKHVVKLSGIMRSAIQLSVLRACTGMPN